MDAEKIARVLAGAPVFSALSDAERSELVPHLRARRFYAMIVFHRDDPAGHVYVILSGSMKVSILDEEGREIVVAVGREGAVFGELALFDDAPRSAPVTALDETQVVTLAREDFLRVPERSPRATREIPSLSRAHHTTRVRADRGPGFPRRAPARREVPYSTPRLRTPERRSSSPRTTAAFVGATRVSVSRALADLEAQGAITVGRRHILVNEPALLRKQARSYGSS